GARALVRLGRYIRGNERTHITFCRRLALKVRNWLTRAASDAREGQGAADRGEYRQAAGALVRSGDERSPFPAAVVRRRTTGLFLVRDHSGQTLDNGPERTSSYLLSACLTRYNALS